MYVQINPCSVWVPQENLVQKFFATDIGFYDIPIH